MGVNLQEIIKVSPTTARPYPHMRCYMGSKGKDYFEEITRERALAILEAGYTLDLIKASGERMNLTKDYLLNTETERVEEMREDKEEEEPVEEVIDNPVRKTPLKEKRK